MLMAEVLAGLVVEKLEELRHIITLSKQIGVEPLIGIRARLHAKGAGKWAESGGENAKFGLSTAELLTGSTTSRMLRPTTCCSE